MRDGSVIALGCGNEERIRSVSHGTSRLMSRREARQLLGLDEHRAEMEGAYTTNVSGGALEEAPMTYKSAGQIIGVIGGYVDIKEVFRLAFNFKAQGLGCVPAGITSAISTLDMGND